MDSQIAKKNQSLTTAQEMRNQTMLIMQPYANWEQYLTPAPLSIAILGELVHISSNTDFSINKNPPKDGYKYIRYPYSFRACLMQVCNSGWWAFNEAHKNMDQIRLHTMVVPNYMKMAVKILFQGNDEVVQAHLPDQLENIRVIADDCLQLATSTQKRFTAVINIVHELLEACVNAQHFYGEELDAVKKKLDEAKLRKETSEKESELVEKAMNAIEEQLKEAQETYKDAMESLPSGWNLIAMDLVASLAEGIQNILNPFAVIANLKKHSHKTEDKESDVDAVDILAIYCKSGEILTYTGNVQQYVQDDTINWKELYDQKTKATKTDFIADQFKRIFRSLEQRPNCTEKADIQDICFRGIEICEELAKFAPEGKCEEAKTKELMQRIRNLNKSARSFDSKIKAATNTPALTPKPPMMNKVESTSENVTASGRASENARFKIEQSRAQLDKTREVYDKRHEDMKKTQKELTEILITMRNCEVKEIDFKTTIEMLGKGMDAMGRVKEQWEKMVRFFQMVSNIVKTSLTRTLKDFAITSEKTEKLTYNSKLFSKDLLYMQAFQATNIANLVNMISTTYTEVSDQHLMDRVSSLGKLMVMDKTKPDYLIEVEQLRNSCEEAQEAILALVLKNKEEFERRSIARQEKIDQELLAILPAAPEEEKSIREAVQSGFTEEEVEDYI